MPPPEPQYRTVESGQSRVATSDSEQRRKSMDGSDKSMGQEEYNKALRALQVELCALQDWVVKTGLRVVVVFEGRDAAGKGGIIKVLTERVSPRGSAEEGRQPRAH